MGVDRTDYLMYGVRIDPEKVNYDDHLALIEGQPGAPFDLIRDGMSGEYAIAGKVITKTNGYEDGLGFIEITDDLLPQNPGALKDAIEAVFGELPDKLRLFMFSHYS